MDDEEEWQPDEEVSFSTRAKILSLKVCRHRSLAHSSSEKALEIATPVLKLLATLVEHNGSVSLTAPQEYVDCGDNTILKLDVFYILARKYCLESDFKLGCLCCIYPPAISMQTQCRPSLHG